MNLFDELPANEKPRKVECLTCKALTTPDEHWRCHNCKQKCYYGWGSCACPHCGETKPAQREGYRYKRVFCDCQLPPAERARRDREQARRDAMVKADEVRADAELQAQIAHSVNADAAAHCWEHRKKKNCNVLLTQQVLPFPKFCRLCPKFKGRPAPELRTASPTGERGYKPPLKTDIPMQEIDVA